MSATGVAGNSNIVNSTHRKNRSSIRLANGRQSAPIGALTARKKPYSDKVPPRNAPQAQSDRRSNYLFFRAADSTLPWTLTVPTRKDEVASSMVTSKLKA